MLYLYKHFYAKSWNKFQIMSIFNISSFFTFCANQSMDQFQNFKTTKMKSKHNLYILIVFIRISLRTKVKLFKR